MTTTTRNYTEHPSKNNYVIQPFISAKAPIEKDNLQLFDSSSDISSALQCCTDKHTDSSFCSESSASGHTSVCRPTPTHSPTHPTYNPAPPFQQYQYKNLNSLQEEAASECCSLMGKETNI